MSYLFGHLFESIVGKPVNAFQTVAEIDQAVEQVRGKKLTLSGKGAHLFPVVRGNTTASINQKIDAALK